MLYNRSIGTTITRICISILLMKDFIAYLLFSDIFFGPTAIVPNSLYQKLLEAYHLKWLQLNFNDGWICKSIIVVGLGSSIIFLMGQFRMLAGFILTLILLELRLRNIYILDGADNVISVTLPFLFVSYSRPLWKLNFLPSMPRISALRRTAQLVAIKGLAIQFSFIYFFAAFEKFNSALWLNGEALYYALRLKDFMYMKINVWLTQSALFVKSLTYITLIWESAFPLLVWFKKVRIYIISISILMHLGILLLMRIDNYSILMICFYPIFFTNLELTVIYDRLVFFINSFRINPKNVKDEKIYL